MKINIISIKVSIIKIENQLLINNQIKIKKIVIIIIIKKIKIIALIDIIKIQIKNN